MNLEQKHTVENSTCHYGIGGKVAYEAAFGNFSLFVAKRVNRRAITDILHNNGRSARIITGRSVDRNIHFIHGQTLLSEGRT